MGAVYRNKLPGVTAYVQYSMAFLQGRLQIDLLSSQTWLSQFAVGVPISIGQFKLEPHLAWDLGQGPKEPRLGFRAQYVF